MESNLLRRVLTDGQTGLPSILYFRLIRDWEERRARRRDYQVRVVRVNVRGGSGPIRRELGVRLCREVRTSDLIASEGAEHFRVLLTSPDAEQAPVLCERIQRLVSDVNEGAPADVRLAAEVWIEAVREAATQSPCDPCDIEALETPLEHPSYAPPPEKKTGGSETAEQDPGTTPA